MFNFALFTSVCSSVDVLVYPVAFLAMFLLVRSLQFLDRLVQYLELDVGPVTLGESAL